MENDIVYVDQRLGGPEKGLSFVVREEDDKLFNNQLQKFIKLKDYRYVASAIRDEPERLSLGTRHLIAEILENVSKINPAHRPIKNKPTAADERSAILQREFNTMEAQGMEKRKIYKFLRDKHGLSQETLKDNLDKSSFWASALKDHPGYKEFLKLRASVRSCKKPD